MSGIIKRLFLAVVRGRFKTVVYGPYTARSQAQDLVDKSKQSSDVLEAEVSEMPANTDEPTNIIEWLNSRYPNT